MSTLIKGSKYTGDILLEKQLGTTLTLNTNQRYVDSDVEFNISVQSGISAANTATANASIQSGGTGNISSSIGSASSTQPSSGYFIKIQAEGSGSSKITTPGWVEAGALSAASTTSTKYFPIASATFVAGSGSIDSTGLLTIPFTKTAGYTPAGIESGTYQLSILGETTYPTSSSNQVIAANKYTTGTQTILGVSTSSISAENIRTGTTIKVGDTADVGRIANVSGTFTDSSTVSSGQTAAGASQIVSGYSAWVDGVEVQGNLVSKSISDITTEENVVTIPSGVYPSENTVTINEGTITSGSTTISIITHEYNETSGGFDVSGTGTIGAPTVGTAGYVSSTKGTKNGNTAIVAATENKIVGTVSFSGASTRKPSITKQDTPEGVTNAASGGATTTVPSTGVYVAVKTSANTGTLTATPVVTGEGYGTAGNNGLAANTQTVGASASDMTYVPITTTIASVDGRTVSYGPGWIAGGSTQINVGTVTSSPATISTVAYTYNSENDNFSVDGTAAIAAPSVVTAGYISSSEGTRNGNTATVAASVAKIVGSISINGTKTFTPSIAKQNTPSGVTNAASGNATTTAPSSGVYVAVKSAANTGTITAIPSVTTAGYGNATNHGIANGSAVVGADASSTTYVPIITANPEFTGGGLSGTATASSSTASISDSTNNSGVSFATACTTTRANVTYNGAVAGWVSKSSGTVALSSGSTAMTAKTYYINGVTLTAPGSGTRSFGITVPNGSSTITFTFNVDSSGNVTIT